LSIVYKHVDYKHVVYKHVDYKHVVYKHVDYKHVDYKHVDYKHVDEETVSCTLTMFQHDVRVSQCTVLEPRPWMRQMLSVETTGLKNLASI
jgi:hypothetical protein